MPAQPTMVYPVPGTFLIGEPAIAHEVATRTEAERLVRTGAFALSAEEADEMSPWDVTAMREASAAGEQEPSPDDQAPEDEQEPSPDGDEEEDT